MSDRPTEYGLFAFRSARLALPLESLREVLPCPKALADLPEGGPGVLGAVDLRGAAVPVLDIAGVLGSPDAPERSQVVAVVADQGRLLGLVLDDALGITTVSAEAVRALGDGAGKSLLLPATFTHPQDGGLVSVLDVAAVIRLPGVLTVVEPVPIEDVADAPRGARRTVVLVRCGRVHLALDLTRVQTIQPQAQVRQSCLQAGSCVGALDYGDLEIAAVDPLALAGLGTLELDTPLQALVLELERGYVALLLSDVVTVTHVFADEVFALPPLSVRRPELFIGVVHSSASDLPHLLLDVAALGRDGDLQALSALNTDRRVDGSQTGPGGARTGAALPTYLTYRAGIDVATPLHQIDEITALPAHRSVVGEQHGGVLGTFLHRGELIPLLCLAGLLDRPSPEVSDRTCVLLVSDGDLRVGLVVTELGGIEPSTWEDDAPSARPGHRLAQFGSDADERLLPVVDLLQIVRGLRPQSPVVPAPRLEVTGPDVLTAR